MAFSKTIQMYIFDGMVVYIKFLETNFPNSPNERIRKTLAYTSYLVKMKVILTLSMLVKPKRCSHVSNNILKKITGMTVSQ